jgi:DNA primase
MDVEEMLGVNAEAADLMSSGMMGVDGAEARHYLAKRGISLGVARGVYGIGYAPRLTPDDYRHLADAHGEDPVQILNRFSRRLVWPIRDESGAVVGFGGRLLAGEGPKYLNSAESDTYQKSRVLYGLDAASRAIGVTGRVVIVEGYMDVMAVAQSGIEEVVAICGTAMSWEQGMLLRYRCDEVILSLDNDAAGLKATERIGLLLYGMGFTVKIAKLQPDGVDPDSMIQGKDGAKAYKNALDRAIRLSEWMAERGKHAEMAEAVHGRSEMVASLGAWAV